MNQEVAPKEREFWKKKIPPYQWPRSDHEDDIQYVLHGRFNQLPKPESNIVRIFVSSTFTDTNTERNVLMKNVYPKLKAYCKEQHGLEFQVVDMRWGVRNDASVDHSTGELCMREIKLCQDLSVGPNFVTLLGQRYGSRFLPPQVSAKDMELLMANICIKDDVELVKRWFVKDLNAVPPEYVLRPITDTLTTKEIEELKDNVEVRLNVSRKRWSVIDDRLKCILRTAARLCVEKNVMDEITAYNYIRSVTDAEIDYGIFHAKEAEDHCLCFVRTIEDINLNHDQAWKFIDLNEDNSVDEEAQELLCKLRDTKLPQKLCGSNIYRFTTKWSDNGGVNEADHDNYLKEFCTVFEKVMIEKIEAGIERANNQTKDKLYTEVLEHAHQCVKKVERFHGRADILSAIERYIKSSCNKPLTLYGESGCGKTSVMAKAAVLTPLWLGDDVHLPVVLRFLGTTPDTSSIYATLVSICTQIIKTADLQNEFPDIPQEFADVVQLFQDLLRKYPPTKRLVIYLDSLDQLSPMNEAHRCAWLPKELPKNCKMILSTLPEEYNILSTLKRIFPQTEQFLEVTELPSYTSNEIFDSWLQMNNRTITAAQRGVVHETLRGSARPLFLKLVFDEVKTWRSYHLPTTCGRSITNCIEDLFEQLERKHGKLLTARALGYISASKNGLTEIEIEDILSLDDHVLGDVFQFHIPPIRRLPSILWSRIRSDISEYIVDREADGAKVMAWYHRQFIEAARRRYAEEPNPRGRMRKKKNRIQSDTDISYMSEIIYDYFSGKWSGDVEKPFTYTQEQLIKFGLQSLESRAKRYATPMPSIFKSKNGTIDINNIRYNQRKVSELSFVAIKMFKQGDITRRLCKDIAMNLEFLTAWMACCNWTEVCDALQDFSRDNPYAKNNEGADVELIASEMSLVQQCLLLSYTSLFNNQTAMAPLVTGRLLPYRGAYPRLDEWFEITETEGTHLCALVSPHLQLETPGSELLFMVNNHTGSVTHATMDGNSYKKDFLLSVSKKFVAVDMHVGEVVGDITPKNMPAGDTFIRCRILSKSSQDVLVAAALKNNPWIYIISIRKKQSHLVGQIDLGSFDLNLRMTEMKEANHSGGCLVIWCEQCPDLFLLHPEEIRKGRYDSAVVCMRGTSGESILCAQFITDETMFILRENSLSIIKLIKSKAHADPEDTNTTSQSNVSRDQAEDTPFDFEIVSRFILPEQKLVGYCIGGQHTASHAICLIFEGGLGYLFIHSVEANGAKSQDSDQRFHLQNNTGKLLPYFFQTEDTQPHFITVDGIDDSRCTKYEMLVTVCSEDKLETFGLLRRKEENLEAYPKIENMARINGKYTGAVFTGKMKHLLAYKDGMVDIYTINKHFTSIKFSVTIDAHGQPISGIVDIPQASMFVTASEDGSLKFWILDRANKVRKYIPNFDRSVDQIIHVSPAEESAITSGNKSQVLNNWDLPTGRILESFPHPVPNSYFIAHAVLPKNKLVALDNHMGIYSWQLDISSSSVKQKRQAKIQETDSTTAAPVNDTQRLTTFASVFNTASENKIFFKSGDTENNVVCVDTSGKAAIANLHQNSCNQLNLDTRVTDVTSAEVISNDNLVLVCSQRRLLVVHDMMLDAPVSCKTVDEYIGKDECYLNLTSCSNRNQICVMSENNVFIIDPKFKRLLFSIEVQDVETLIDQSFDGNFVAFAAGKACQVLDVNKKQVILTHKYFNAPQFLKITPDGNYIIYVHDDKEIRLVRVRDGKVLAWYSMYDIVESLNVSTNSWYVTIATKDRRLFILLISDPEEPQHQKRIRATRNKNTSLSKEDANELMEIAQNFDVDSSDESSTSRACSIDSTSKGRRRSLSVRRRRRSLSVRRRRRSLSIISGRRLSSNTSRSVSFGSSIDNTATGIRRSRKVKGRRRSLTIEFGDDDTSYSSDLTSDDESTTDTDKTSKDVDTKNKSRSLRRLQSLSSLPRSRSVSSRRRLRSVRSRHRSRSINNRRRSRSISKRRRSRSVSNRRRSRSASNRRRSRSVSNRRRLPSVSSRRRSPSVRIWGRSQSVTSRDHSRSVGIQCVNRKSRSQSIVGQNCSRSISRRPRSRSVHSRRCSRKAKRRRRSLTIVFGDDDTSCSSDLTSGDESTTDTDETRADVDTKNKSRSYRRRYRRSIRSRSRSWSVSIRRRSRSVNSRRRSRSVRRRSCGGSSRRRSRSMSNRRRTSRVRTRGRSHSVKSRVQ